MVPVLASPIGASYAQQPSTTLNSYAKSPINNNYATSTISSNNNNLNVIVIERQADQKDQLKSKLDSLSPLDDLSSVGDNLEADISSTTTTTTTTRSHNIIDTNDDDDDDADDDNNKNDASSSLTSLSQDCPGLYISTSEQNYAIVSPELAINGWLSVSVNGDDVFIVSVNKKFQAGSLKQLDPLKRENLRRLVVKFVSNLQGLQLNDGLNSDGSYYSSTGLGLGNTGDFIYNSNGAFGIATNANLNANSNNILANKIGSYSNSRANQYGQNYGWCSKSFYENTAGSNLNDTLDGDIYYFDAYGNQLNIFSGSVNTFCRDNLSIVFRDQNYFAYSRSNMAYNWNRFFVSGTNVFLIYQDGTVLAKPTWALESSEFNAILRGRLEVKQLVASQQEQAQANGKQLTDIKTADIVNVVKNVLLSSAKSNDIAAGPTNVLNFNDLTSVSSETR